MKKGGWQVLDQLLVTESLPRKNILRETKLYARKMKKNFKAISLTKLVLVRKVVLHSGRNQTFKCDNIAKRRKKDTKLRCELNLYLQS